jgi:hypothetical protein
MPERKFDNVANPPCHSTVVKNRFQINSKDIDFSMSRKAGNIRRSARAEQVASVANLITSLCQTLRRR